MSALSKVETIFPLHVAGHGLRNVFVTTKGDSGAVPCDAIVRDDVTVRIERNGVTLEVPWAQCKHGVVDRGASLKRTAQEIGYDPFSGRHPATLGLAARAQAIAEETVSMDPGTLDRAIKDARASAFEETHGVPAPDPEEPKPKRGRPKKVKE